MIVGFYIFCSSQPNSFESVFRDKMNGRSGPHVRRVDDSMRVGSKTERSSFHNHPFSGLERAGWLDRFVPIKLAGSATHNRRLASALSRPVRARRRGSRALVDEGGMAGRVRRARRLVVRRAARRLAARGVRAGQQRVLRRRSVHTRARWNPTTRFVNKKTMYISYILLFKSVRLLPIDRAAAF